jgi:hypothetical protein
MLEDEGYGAELFHTYCKVGERGCALTIDHDNSINAVGIDMMEKLKLSTTPHPEPYSLRRCRDKIDITHQTMVSFSIEKFSCQILFDVIPRPMVSCHLLLGAPWFDENDATYSFIANTYTGERNNIYVLRTMEKKLFRSWRKEHIQMLKEHEQAKMAQSVVKVSAPAQSQNDIAASETGSKSRTVSPEEGEDEKAAPICTTISFDHVKVETRCRRYEDELIHRS